MRNVFANKDLLPPGAILTMASRRQAEIPQTDQIKQTASASTTTMKR